MAYGPTYASNDRDAVTSLMPKDMMLGQVVPYELVIEVKGSTEPEGGVITVNPHWLAKTTNGGDFGFDCTTYGLIAAFVDTGSSRPP